jgi:hypothetical protein
MKQKRGDIAPSNKVVDETLEDIKKICDTNNKIFIIKNILILIERGFDYKLRAIIKELLTHGKRVIALSKPSIKAHKEFINPAIEISGLLKDISIKAGKGEISQQEFDEFVDDSSKITASLKELELKAKRLAL